MSPVELNHRFDGPQDAPVVVLANSLGTTLGMWDDQLPALTERFRVLRYDQRGRPSMDELGGDLLALLDHVGLERVSLCGLSLGGMVAMWIASEAPERIDRLVLASTSPLLGPRELWDERVEIARTKGTAELADGALERWLTPEFRGTRTKRAGALRGMIVATPDDDYALACEAIRDMDLRARLPAIRSPTLVIGASDDPSTPPKEHGARIADAIPDARLVVIEGARHLVNVERPDEFNRLLLEHLDAEP